MHPPGTLKLSKNLFCWSKNSFLEVFGVPGGCKSILNVKCLHKSHMAELLDRGFFVFRWVKKKVFFANFGHFCPDLKNIFNLRVSLQKNNCCTEICYVWKFLLKIKNLIKFWTKKYFWSQMTFEGRFQVGFQVRFQVCFQVRFQNTETALTFGIFSYMNF